MLDGPSWVELGCSFLTLQFVEPLDFCKCDPLWMNIQTAQQWVDIQDTA